MPPRLRSSRACSFCMREISFLVMFENVPSTSIFSIFLSLSSERFMVEKLVSMPPSQRLLT